MLQDGSNRFGKVEQKNDGQWQLIVAEVDDPLRFSIFCYYKNACHQIVNPRASLFVYYQHIQNHQFGRDTDYGRRGFSRMRGLLGVLLGQPGCGPQQTG